MSFRFKEERMKDIKERLLSIRHLLLLALAMLCAVGILSLIILITHQALSLSP